MVQYPIHKVDDVGSLKDIEPEGEAPAWKKATNKRKDSAKKERRSKAEEFEEVVKNCNLQGAAPYWMSYHGTLQLEKRLRNVP
ncbi:hypothetical protein P7H17_24415 [Paenibacillus larvae]|nr:hypothetical protein [Paenibacillus larvae]MDT2288570.1 hypothetical protein [Paenibacillus larvae]